MDYKEEFFKVFEVLDNLKIALGDALTAVEKMQDEVVGDFAEGKATKEETIRLASHISTGHRSTRIMK